MPSTTSPPARGRVRRSLPKTRTGCGTCKIRRVKCGEEKPICQRCINYGCVCDGYGHLDPTPPKPSKIKMILPKSDPNSQIIKAPKSPLFRREEECLYFENFCSNTSYEILPNFNFNTMRQMLLQAAQQEPAIRHAVVALGALGVPTSEEVNPQTLTVQKLGAKQPRHRLDALEQYLVALKHIKTIVSAGTDVRLISLACILTICFEAWCGNIRAAVLQVGSGQRLIHMKMAEALESRKAIHGSPSMGTADITENDLVQAFLSIDVDIFDESTTALEPNIFEREALAVLAQMPDGFSTVDEAQMYGNALKLQTRRFLSRDCPVPDEQSPRRRFRLMECWKRWGQLPSHVVADYQRLSSSLLRWKVAFEPLWESVKSANYTLRIPAVQTRLDIHYLILELLVLLEIEHEIAFDDHVETFTEIVELAEYILTHSELAKRSFTLQHRTIHPLRYTACKCRDSSIRRKAISLLINYPRREGVWDSWFFGQIADWLMDLEEAYLQEGHVPAWARIEGIQAERDESQYVVTLTCLQRTSEESGEVILHTKVLDERYVLSSRKNF